MWTQIKLRPSSNALTTLTRPGRWTGSCSSSSTGGLAIGRASHKPGRKWSVHVGRSRGQRLCTVEHVGLVLRGTAAAAFEDGKVLELTPGTFFYLPPTPHDRWGVGDESYGSLHFLWADHYAK